MNYIQRLELELASSRRELSALQAGLRELEAYLCSAKFSEDPTVQTRDVLHRLAAVEHAATSAGWEVSP